MKIPRTSLVIFIVIALSPVSIVYADFDKGFSAYTTGDYFTAFKEFRASAHDGDPKSEYFLGTLFIKGQGVKQNYADGTKWLTRAAQHGLAVAQFSLGSMYESGEGVPLDLNEAVRWYREAAELGESMAQYNLGLLYAAGKGVKKNLAEARRWMHRSAEQGEARAYHNLGVLYLNGLGGPRDYLQAYVWLSLSAVNGDTEDAKLRDELETAMTSSQIADAKKLAREWKPKENLSLKEFIFSK